MELSNNIVWLRTGFMRYHLQDHGVINGNKTVVFN